MSDIVEFLNARLDEVEADALAAQEADPMPWEAHESTGKTTDHAWQLGAGLVTDANEVGLWDCEGSNTLCMAAPTARHVARHDPARVLAEVKAKRAILKAHACVWLVDQWVQAADGQRRKGELRVCRSCEPMTGFMTDQWPCDTVKLLAAPDADHPDYNPAWDVASG